MLNLRRMFIGPLIASVVLLGSSQAALSWTDADYDRYDYDSFERLESANRRIDMENIDYPLLNAALFFETNRQRAMKGRNPLRHSSALEKAASGHSRDMVRHNFFGHESPVAGKRDISDRIVREGLTVRNESVGENISDVFGKEYENGKRIYPPNKNRNRNYFSYTRKGEPIQNRTYIGLAKAALKEWMNSRYHRENILHPEFKYVGTGAAHYQDAGFYDMDRFRLTQNFAGEILPPSGKKR